jgi:DNA mismatch repair ATPase MutL
MFGKSDIEEICGVLNVHPGMMVIIEIDFFKISLQYRPEKLRKIFASWSCRMSVMIGKQLKLCDMKKIVRNMGTLDNPWNCPVSYFYNFYLSILILAWSPNYSTLVRGSVSASYDRYF